MEMIDQAIKVLEGRTAVSTTTLQRQLRIGYWQAGRLIGELKEQCRITEDWDASEGGYRVLGGGRTPGVEIKPKRKRYIKIDFQINKMMYILVKT